MLHDPNRFVESDENLKHHLFLIDLFFFPLDGLSPRYDSLCR